MKKITIMASILGAFLFTISTNVDCMESPVAADSTVVSDGSNIGTDSDSQTSEPVAERDLLAQLSVQVMALREQVAQLSAQVKVLSSYINIPERKMLFREKVGVIRGSSDEGMGAKRRKISPQQVIQIDGKNYGEFDRYIREGDDCVVAVPLEMLESYVVWLFGKTIKFSGKKPSIMRVKIYQHFDGNWENVSKDIDCIISRESFLGGTSILPQAKGQKVPPRLCLMMRQGRTLETFSSKETTN